MTDTEHKGLVAVLGAGESGVGAAILAKDKGYDVLVSDSGAIPAGRAATLEAEGIAYEQGGHSTDTILGACMAIKSPGIPPTAPIVQALVAKGIPVLSEIEFAGRFTDSKMICITGSNGKTTTTLLIHHLLRRAGVDAGLAGNVGHSLALQVARDPHPVYVIELSSFQLENMYDFKADIAVMLNITPDHLDRYDYDMQNYINAKFRILNNMTASDAFIYWQDDPVIARQLEHIQLEARRIPFGERKLPGSKAWTDGDGALHMEPGNGTTLSMPRAELALDGLHNLLNSMAAGLAGSLAGIPSETIRAALSDFEGVEHRLEYTATVNGVRYINDSKATNVNSCWYALESMPASRSTVLILGGKDKGNDYTEILPLVLSKVKAIVAMGKDNAKIKEFFGDKVPVEDTHSVADAVAACARLAAKGDTVLLSPCCASFDLFKSYEDRGRQFKALIKAMAANS